MDMAVTDGSMVDMAEIDAAIDAAPGECPDPTVVDSDVEADATWPSVNRRGCLDYLVAETLDVRAALVVEPAAEVGFAEGAGLRIRDGGSLSAIGTEPEPIVFTGESPVAGYWESLVFDSDSADNELRHAVVEHGGRGEDFAFSGNVPTNVLVTSDGRLALRDSTMRLSGEHGLYLQDGASLASFNTNVFDDNGGAPIRLASNQLGMLDGTSSFSGNGESHIDVASATTEEAQTWPATQVPLRFSGEHFIDLPAVSETVTIAEGAVIELATAAGIRVDGGGLSAVGTADDPIVFRGATASPGLWEALVFWSDSPANRLEWVEISDGGRGELFGFSGETPAQVTVGATDQLAILDSTLTGGADVGLEVEPGGTLADFARNTFGGNEGPPVRLPSNQLGSLDAASDYDGDGLSLPNGDEYLHVTDSTTTDAATWSSIDLPYRFFGKHFIDMDSASDAVTVEAGADFELADGAGIKVSNGAFRAIGDPADLIVFHGAVETPGYWESIIFDSNDPANEIAHADIAHGGKGDDFSFSGNTPALIIVTSGAQATIRDSFLSDSGDLCFAGSGSRTLIGNTLTNCN